MRSALVISCLAALGGCRTYQPDPPDLRAIAADFNARAGLLSPSTGERALIDRETAEGLALLLNPDLRLARARAGVTLATAENSGLWEDPRLSVDLARILAGGPDAWMGGAMLGITIPLSGRLEAESRSAEASHALELARIHEQEWALRSQVRRAWAERVAAAERSSILDDFLSDISSLTSLVESRELAGESRRLDGDAFRLELAMAGLARRAEALNLEERDLALLRLLGLGPGSRVEFSRAQPPAPDPIDSIAPNFTSGLHPALITALREHDVAERDLALEIRRQFPDLVVGMGLGREDGRGRLLLGLELPLPFLNRNRQGIARAEAMRGQARANLERTFELLAGEFALASARHRSAIERLAIASSEVLPASERQRRAALDEAALGEVNPMMLMRTLIASRDARLALTAARLDESLASIRARELAGPTEVQP